ncbi:hypothetical protein [Mucilaginibacter celer]|uniref:Uncharacterized protein n=1 Tax=Mucilaginibacter celer TaxID=2305508 RepID=A0A494W4I7_9SPHI|nr:hypothetical protein [Mucilaginibacter celer]AYL98458.1 hypothetical protein HYN43_025650 [Mucilaginibacter celer]
MPLPYNHDIKAILERRYHRNLLYGYYGGIFNPVEDKFYACTWVKLSTVDYDEFIWHHEQLMGSSAMYFDIEKTRKQVDSNSWQSKTPKECIDEGIYLYFSVLFMGVFFENEWFITPSLCFYGNDLEEVKLKERAEANITSGKTWESSLFLPEKEIDLKGYPKMGLSPTSLEFKNVPWMVSIIKQERKERLNHAYCIYINEEYLKPFFEKLKIRDYENFVSADQLRYGYTMIFPEHKKYTLFCGLIENNQGKWRLEYFFLNEGKFYRWTYFSKTEHDFSFFYGDLIIADLQQISNWDQEPYLDSSCTMDDPHFWNCYVFSRDSSSGEFLYLEEIHFD